VIEVEDLMYLGRSEVVDNDLADDFGSIPHADLLKSAALRIIERAYAASRKKQTATRS